MGFAIDKTFVPITYILSLRKEWKHDIGSKIGLSKLTTST